MIKINKKTTEKKGETEMINIYTHDNGAWVVNFNDHEVLKSDLQGALQLAGFWCEQYNIDTNDVTVYTPNPTLQF